MIAHCQACGEQLESAEIMQEGVVVAQYWTHGDTKDAKGIRPMDEDHYPEPYEGTA